MFFIWKKVFFIQEVSGVCSSLFLDTVELNWNDFAGSESSGTFGKRAASEVFVKLILGENQSFASFTRAFAKGNCQLEEHVILMRVAVADIYKVSRSNDFAVFTKRSYVG